MFWVFAYCGLFEDLTFLGVKLIILKNINCISYELFDSFSTEAKEEIQNNIQSIDKHFRKIEVIMIKKINNLCLDKIKKHIIHVKIINYLNC